MSASVCDEIAELARGYMLHPGLGGLKSIDLEIDRAQASGCWDDMNKWHRVRLRLIRLRQQEERAQLWPLARDSARA